MNIFVSTHPFSQTSEIPGPLLKKENLQVRHNPYEHKISTEELAAEIKSSDALIAGTEKITRDVFKNAPNLKIISRVGIGLDGIDFGLCKEFGVRVTYTPDAPSMAASELCVGLILDVARKISETNANIKSGIWYRYMGMLLYGKTIGIVGMGRIGKGLVHLLSAFNMKMIVHDIKPDVAFGRLNNVSFVTKKQLLQESDIVSINVPLKKDTHDLITIADLKQMKSTSMLINTARGGIVNEEDLCVALRNNIIAGAAVDVFEQEPYNGPLTTLENCILTCHMGASTVDSRTAMEVEAVEEVIRFHKGQQLKNEVFGNE